MSASGPASGAGGGESLPSHAAEVVPAPDLPSGVIEVYLMTKSGTSLYRRRFAKPLLDACSKPTKGSILLGHGGFGAVFRVALPTGNAEDVLDATPDHIAVKAVFNWGLSTSKLETIDSQKEFDVLARLPEHRNVARVLFECVCKPPVWMVEMLPDPSLVCIAAGDYGDFSGEGMPSAGAASLQPRKAQMVGVELLQRRMCDHLEILEGDEPGSMPDGVLIQLSSDIAEGVHHLLQHGVVHRDMKLDNVMWDSKGGPKGVGRAVLIDLGCSLRVHVREASARSAGLGSGAGIPGALDGVMYRYLKDGGDGLGGNQAHLAPEVLDGWNRGAAGDMDAVVPFGKQASWELGVLLHELATGGQHPFGDHYPGEVQDGSKPRPGELAAALHACEAPLAGDDVLSKRPGWYADMVRGLLCIDPGDRMGVSEAVHMMRPESVSGVSRASAADVRSILPALRAGGAECETAVARIREVVDGLVAPGDWDGVYRVLWQLRIEYEISSLAELSSSMRQVMSDAVEVMALHALSDPGEVIKVVSGLGLPVGSDGLRQSVVDAGALGGLVALLGSGKGKEAEQAAWALGNIADGSDGLRQSVVDAGALGGLVALLGSGKGQEAEQAATALRNIAVGPVGPKAEHIFSFTILQAEDERLKQEAASARGEAQATEIRSMQMVLDRQIQNMLASRDSGELTPELYTKGLLKGARQDRLLARALGEKLKRLKAQGEDGPLEVTRSVMADLRSVQSRVQTYESDVKGLVEGQMVSQAQVKELEEELAKEGAAMLKHTMDQMEAAAQQRQATAAAPAPTPTPAPAPAPAPAPTSTPTPAPASQPGSSGTMPPPSNSTGTETAGQGKQQAAAAASTGYVVPRDHLRAPLSPMLIFSFEFIMKEQARLEYAVAKGVEGSDIELMAVEDRMRQMFEERDSGALTPELYARKLVRGMLTDQALAMELYKGKAKDAIAEQVLYRVKCYRGELESMGMVAGGLLKPEKRAAMEREINGEMSKQEKVEIYSLSRI